MGIISCASGSSCWRGLDYYKNNKVIKLNIINNFEFPAIIDGTKKYDVYLNIEHPRKSKCNCPLANGKKIFVNILLQHILRQYQVVQSNLKMNKKYLKKNMKNIKIKNMKMPLNI